MQFEQVCIGREIFSLLKDKRMFTAPTAKVLNLQSASK